MEEARKKQLEAAGIDVDDALSRFMDNESLMVKFLLRFPQDQNFRQLQEALAAGDAAGAYTAAHTLKGVAGNLSMAALFRQASAVTEDLRKEDLAGAAARMGALEAEYHRVIAALTGLA